jgi:hypothetical protein
MQIGNSSLKYGYNRQNRVSSMLIRLPISESQKSVCVVPLCCAYCHCVCVYAKMAGFQLTTA